MLGSIIAKVLGGTIATVFLFTIVEYFALYVVGLHVADRLGLLEGDGFRKIMSVHLAGFVPAYVLVFYTKFLAFDLNTVLMVIFFAAVVNGFILPRIYRTLDWNTP